MSLFLLHRAVDGLPRSFVPDDIKSVGEEPAGQTMVWLSDGTVFQPSESLEEVTRLIMEASK